MTELKTDTSSALLQMTAEIVANYVSGNTIARPDLPALIQSVHAALSNIDGPEIEAAPSQTKLTTAQIRKSITPDALISFEDGKPYKTLKRHLSTNGLTIEEYKAKYGLPADYPTVAPNYSAARSAMAKSLGLEAPEIHQAVKMKLNSKTSPRS